MPISNNREAEPRETLPEEEKRPNLELNTRYGLESFSLGNTISRMMEEDYFPEPYFTEREVLPVKEREPLNFMLKDIMDGLRHSPEIIKMRLKVKEEGYEALSPEERKEIFKIYDRIREAAFEAAQKKFGRRLSPQTLRRIKFNTVSELNYSLRNRIIEGAEPEGWMILEPKLRKVDLMDAKTMMRYLRNSLNPKGELEFIRQEVEKGAASEEMKKTAAETSDEEIKGQGQKEAA